MLFLYNSVVHTSIKCLVSMQGLLLRANRLAFIHTSPGVDNQANYAHSPPKSCCTATAKSVGV